MSAAPVRGSYARLRMAFALLATVIFVFPILWMFLTAFKTGNQAFSNSAALFFTPTLENFRAIIVDSDFGSAVLTSVKVAGLSTLLALLLGSGIAYPMARYPFRGEKSLAEWMMSLRIIPPIVTIIPMFLIMRAIGLSGTDWSVIVVYTFMNLPLAVWLLRGFYRDVPKEIEEAAELDGLGQLGIFFRIVVPLAAPGIVATGLLCLMFAWNDFLFANILTGANTRTATVALTEFVTPVGVAWTKIMAAGTVVVLPVFIAALGAQKYLVRGLTMGSVK